MPRLVIRDGLGVGRDHALGGAPCVLGRDPAVDFPLEDPLASRHHVRILPEGGAWYAQDLGSTNGTRINGRRIRKERLRDGDTIRVGTTEIGFVQKDLLARRPSGRPSART